MKRNIVQAAIGLAALACLGAGPASNGLPEESPDLYSPEVIAQFHLERESDRPDGLHSTVLTSSYAYSQTQEGVRTPLVMIIGFLTEPRNKRIIAIVETFLHPDTGLRSLRGWVDRGWLTEGKASGEWLEPNGPGISPPMPVADVKGWLWPITAAVERGLKQAKGR